MAPEQVVARILFAFTIIVILIFVFKGLKEDRKKRKNGEYPASGELCGVSAIVRTKEETYRTGSAMYYTLTLQYERIVCTIEMSESKGAKYKVGDQIYVYMTKTTYEDKSAEYSMRLFK
jgi:hypothetical protein